MNKQTFLSSTLKHALLILATTPWTAACGLIPELPAKATPGVEAMEPSMKPSMDYDCSGTNGPIKTFATVDEVKTALTGKWGYCSGEPANFKEPTEFTADGHWYTLTRDSDGQLVRKGGFSSSGTYDINTSGIAPWTSVDIVLHYDSFSSTLYSNLAFLDLPRAMQNGPGIYVPID